MKKPSFGLLLLLILVFCSCATSGKNSIYSVDKNDSLETIDVHMHTIFADHEATAKKVSLDLKKTKQDYLNELEEANVVGGVAHVLYSGAGYENFKDKNIIHCYGAAYKVNGYEAERALKSQKLSCIKVYLGYIHRYAYDKEYEPLYKLAEKYDVPVVFHTGDTSTKDALLKYTDPLTIDEVAVKHPKVRFVIAHCGNPWIESAAEVAYKNDNVYLDGSAFLIGDLSKIEPARKEEYLIKPLRWIFNFVENPEKLMFGTDWPLTSISQYKEEFKKAIPKEHWKAVFHDNALKVFKNLK